jgi:hypothetical protein
MVRVKSCAIAAWSQEMNRPRPAGRAAGDPSPAIGGCGIFDRRIQFPSSSAHDRLPLPSSFEYSTVIAIAVYIVLELYCCADIFACLLWPWINI